MLHTPTNRSYSLRCYDRSWSNTILIYKNVKIKENLNTWKYYWT
jgi:hypothetical protein